MKCKDGLNLHAKYMEWHMEASRDGNTSKMLSRNVMSCEKMIIKLGILCIIFTSMCMKCSGHDELGRLVFFKYI